jgi:hypothetical protein
LLHACTVEDGSLIGMGATLCDGSKVRSSNEAIGCSAASATPTVPLCTALPIGENSHLRDQLLWHAGRKGCHSGSRRFGDSRHRRALRCTNPTQLTMQFPAQCCVSIAGAVPSCWEVPGEAAGSVHPQVRCGRGGQPSGCARWRRERRSSSCGRRTTTRSSRPCTRRRTRRRSPSWRPTRLAAGAQQLPTLLCQVLPAVCSPLRTGACLACSLVLNYAYGQPLDVRSALLHAGERSVTLLASSASHCRWLLLICCRSRQQS